MGQPITVVEKPSSRPGVVRFEINRSITGTGHEHYRSLDDATGDRPPDRLARALFEHPGVQGVHVNSNVITVDTKGGDTSGLFEIVESLFLYYRPGVEVQMVAE
ncbi:MAG: NifU N-terminal domain-containing protein [Acidimicrobiales bacterium]|nr:NifU N-terminal domain-containing protein [Acidimicrobiales bacterium]